MPTIGETSRHAGAEMSPSWLRFGCLCIAVDHTQGCLFCRQHFQTKLGCWSTTNMEIGCERGS